MVLITDNMENKKNESFTGRLVFACVFESVLAVIGLTVLFPCKYCGWYIEMPYLWLTIYTSISMWVNYLAATFFVMILIAALFKEYKLCCVFLTV